MTTRRVLLPALALSAALALTGCTPDQWAIFGGGVGTGGSEGGSSGADSSASPTAEGSGDANGCPIGSWLLDNDSWDAALTALWRPTVADAEVDISGALELDWAADGTYVITADESVYVATGTSSGEAFAQTVTHDGTESGTWSGSGTRFELVATDSTGMTSVASISSGGGEYALDVSETTEAWSGSMEVTCTPTGMTTTVTEADGTITVAWFRR